MKSSNISKEIDQIKNLIWTDYSVDLHLYVDRIIKLRNLASK
jgi:hypothetical protein